LDRDPSQIPVVPIPFEHSLAQFSRSLARGQSEFAEETGYHPDGDFLPLGEARQPGGKAIEGDWDPALIRSNTFEMEWPPRSGRRQTFPEIDRAGLLSPTRDGGS
jgi:predicted NUDIX family NTP pyrophosphohydrolase